MQRFLRTISVLSLGGLLFLLLLRPAPAMQGVRDGLLLFGNSVLPAVLPFFVLSSLIMQAGMLSFGAKAFGFVKMLYRLGGSASGALWLCLLTGAPNSARVTRQLHDSGRIDGEEAKRLLAAGTLTGPLFLIGTVGALLGSYSLGAYAYGVQLVSALLNGLLWRGRGKMPARQSGGTRDNAGISFFEALPKALSDSCNAALLVGCAVCVFSALASSLRALGVLDVLGRILSFALPAEAMEPLFSGALEVSIGCRAAAGCGLPLGTRLTLVCTLAGFGGFSILCQSACFLKGLVPVRVYLAQRLSHALLCLIVCRATQTLVLRAIPVWAPLNATSLGADPTASYLAFALTAGLGVLLRLMERITSSRR